ncbi:hypothetical protein EG68_01018 [Paragonimus skrjabini miyazakii]|uniref:CST complex subunit CTC1 n=1 Tax=Paragonimus skrjabini miyazakii TaxID=59628 RepID=A0A8S9ZA70_9TREM|nr:hypothetical protein EG68_01018 [Paragonimus skrjabini miyazakii]
MISRRTVVRSLVPRRVRVNRKSVSCNLSANWIDCVTKQDSQIKIIPRRVVTRFTSEQDHLTSDEIDLINLSPVSSPECDYLAGVSHELLTIEATEMKNTSVEFIEQRISEPCSVTSSQQSICESTERPSADEVARYSSPTHEPSSMTCDYLCRLRRDALSVPYLDLGRRLLNRHRPVKNSLAARLCLLIRRSLSERSMWLHQSVTGEPTGAHPSRVFRVVACDLLQFAGTPGLIAFRVSESRSVHESADRISAQSVSALLLPTSGYQTKTHDLPNSEYGPILGDSLNVGDVLRVFAPWSVLSDPLDLLKPVVLYAFFWVERLRPRDAQNLIEVDRTPETRLTKMYDPVPLACSCLLSGLSSVIQSCPHRFRVPCELEADAVDAVDTGSIGHRSLNLDKWQNPILVLDICQFWFMNKLRKILLVLYHAVGHGLVLLPDDASLTSGFKPSPLWADVQLGNVYATEGLLQLPSSDIPQSLQLEIMMRLQELQLQVSGVYVDKFTRFIQSNGLPAPKTTVATEASSAFGHCCLSDARAATVTLAIANYIRLPEPMTFQANLPLFTRCHLDGLFVYEIPEGSLLKSLILQQIKSGSDSPSWKTTDQADRFSGLLNQATRISFLLVGRSKSAVVVPCICILTVLSPLNLIVNQCKLPTSVLNLASFCGTPVSIDCALVGCGCLIVDHFSNIRMRSHRTQATSSSAFRRPPDIESVRLNSSSVDTGRLRTGIFVQFSGLLKKVSRARSHTWPVCSVCLSSDLTLRYGLTSTKLALFTCQRCLTCAPEPLQLMELEVLVQLDDNCSSEASINPLCVNRSQALTPWIVLNMSTTRLFKLLDLPLSVSIKNMQFNPKTLLSRRLSEVIGLIVHIDLEYVISCESFPVLGIHVIEVDAVPGTCSFN